MIYDKIELLKMGITEQMIQVQRDRIKDFLSKDHEENIKTGMMIYRKEWLPFVVDMIDDYKFQIEPFGFGLVRLSITL